MAKRGWLKAALARVAREVKGWPAWRRNIPVPWHLHREERGKNAKEGE